MKNYENISIEILLFPCEDVIRTSNNDNLGEMPDFPENFG